MDVKMRIPSRLALAIFLAFLPLAVVAATAAAVDETVAADSIVDLNLRKNFCITVGLHQPLRNQTSEQFLLGVNGEDLTNSSFEQIKKKLAGPAGSEVKLEIGYPSGDTEIFNIARAMHKERVSRTADPFQDLSNRLLNQRRNFSLGNLVENSTYNSDMFVKTSCILGVARNGAIDKSSIGTLMNCALLSFSYGDFDEADKYLAGALNLMKSGPADSNTNYREKAVIEDLILLNRNGDAEALCTYLLRPDSNRSFRLPQPITVLTSYSLIPAKSAQEASKQLALQIFSGLVSQSTSFGGDTYWLAQYLESQGANDKALVLYDKTVKKLQAAPYLPNYDGTQELAFGLYSKARLEALAGKRDDAEKDLDSIKTSYKLLSAKQQQLLNRIPEFFPKLLDVDKALSSLKNSGAIPAPPKAVDYSNQDPLVTSGSSPAFKLSFQNAKNCYSLIRANKKAEAESVARQLLTAYSESAPSKAYSVRQNLFSTILHLARMFADRSWYEESNRILASLESNAKDKSTIPPSDIGWAMIDAERVYNAAAMSGKDPSASLWLAINPGIRAPNGLSLSDRLSVLAKVYSLAEESKRAKLFIDHAIKEIDTVNGVYGTNAVDKQALIYMTAASIYAKQSDFRNAENYSKLALNSSRRLSEDFADALIDVANALSSHGKIDTAISILEQGKKLDPAPGGRMYEADFTRILAELYAKNGQADKAIPTLVQGFETNGRSSSAKDYALAAQLSEQSKDYISAAKFYYEAGKSYGNGFTEEQRESMLRKSIECANHAKDSDEFTLAKAYKDLSSIVSRRSSSEALSLLEKSVALVPDSAREKAEELASISYLRGQVVDAKTKTSGSVNAAVELSSAEFEVRSEPLRRAAELASKNNSTEAGNYWLQLARLDVQGKHFGAALDDARKAIATYKSDSVKTHTISQLIDANFPLLIAKAGAPDKAEQIMREAQNQVDTLAGAGSLQSQVQMSHHFIYLYTQKLYSQADSVLDAFLNTDLNQGHYASPNHNMTICRLPGPYPVESSQSVIDRLIQELPRTPSGQDNVHEIHVLNKILSAEKKQFGQNDYRVGLMFVKIGGVFAAANQNDEAYKNFIAALNIMHQYESLTFALNNLGPDFATVMQKLHKQHELEKFEEQKLEEQKSDPFGMRKKTR